jgi:sugar/nucleoside kinase (ribokinase family)
VTAHRIVVVGHLGFESVKTPIAERRSLGGSAYYTAIGAAVSGGPVSVISVVGDDYPLDTLRALGIDVSRVTVAKGKSPQFDIQYLPTLAERTLELDLGVGGGVLRIPDDFDFSDVGYVHVATNLPQTQIEMIERVRALAPHAPVSADCFDQFVIAYPKAACQVVEAADLIFANQVEYQLIERLCGEQVTAIVVNKGEQGAVYRRGTESVAAAAPPAGVVDPTGAGDAFAGAYLARRAQGFDQAAALSDACRVGATAVQSFGADALIKTLKTPR